MLRVHCLPWIWNLKNIHLYIQCSGGYSVAEIIYECRNGQDRPITRTIFFLCLSVACLFSLEIENSFEHTHAHGRMKQQELMLFYSLPYSFSYLLQFLECVYAQFHLVKWTDEYLTSKRFSTKNRHFSEHLQNLAQWSVMLHFWSFKYEEQNIANQ